MRRSAAKALNRRKEISYESRSSSRRSFTACTRWQRRNGKMQKFRGNESLFLAKNMLSSRGFSLHSSTPFFVCVQLLSENPYFYFLLASPLRKYECQLFCHSHFSCRYLKRRRGMNGKRKREKGENTAVLLNENVSSLIDFASSSISPPAPALMQCNNFFYILIET